MRWDDLKKRNKAPQYGQMLVYTREKVIFCAYENLDHVKKEVEEKDLLEIHLFDEEREYRGIVTRSRRFEGGIIETIVTDETEQGKDKYEEPVLLLDDEPHNMVTVVNYIKYDDQGEEATGMASIDNYRLKL